MTIETKNLFLRLLRAAKEYPKIEEDLTAALGALGEKYESILNQLNKKIEENIPTFIFVYGTHGNGNDSFVCSDEIKLEEQQLLKRFGGFQLPLKRIFIGDNGDCYIIITTEQLKKFAENMMKVYSIPMRGAEDYPYIVLKFTYEQLMRLDGDSLDKDTNESFFTEKGEDITSVLAQTRTGMSGSPYISFPKIGLKLNQDDIPLDARDTQIIHAIILLFKYGIKVQHSNTSDKSVRITNNGSKLELSEMITLAQHLLFLIESGRIDRKYGYNLVTEQVNSVFFNKYGSNNQIDCSAKNSDEIKSSEKLHINIAEGICTPENIKSIYEYFMKQCSYIRLLPQLNEIADKADNGTFDENDYKEYRKILPTRQEVLIFDRERKNKESLYKIIEILCDLQDPDNPIVPEAIVEAIRTAKEKDPIDQIAPVALEFFNRWAGR